MPTIIEATGSTTVEPADGYFTYPPDTADVARWHVNFANLHLFVAYGSALMAQDELQCMEHPVLGSLREALLADPDAYPRLVPLTRENGQPAPVLVRGAQRSMAIDTSGGLYGNAFARAPLAAIQRATTYLEEPMFSNIVAMQAPPGGFGPYSMDEIEDILTTAFIGFGACRSESAAASTEVHTGNWGTGAFGGNRVLMALLQVLAAQWAGVDRLVYHSGDGLDHVTEATRLLDELPAQQGMPVVSLIDAIYHRGFTWGVSDGN